MISVYMVFRIFIYIYKKQQQCNSIAAPAGGDNFDKLLKNVIYSSKTIVAHIFFSMVNWGYICGLMEIHSGKSMRDAG